VNSAAEPEQSYSRKEFITLRAGTDEDQVDVGAGTRGNGKRI
jgi:hypothetical protein